MKLRTCLQLPPWDKGVAASVYNGLLKAGALIKDLHGTPTPTISGRASSPPPRTPLEPRAQGQGPQRNLIG